MPPSRFWMRALKVGIPVAAAVALLAALWITQLRYTVFARTKAVLAANRKWALHVQQMPLGVIEWDLDFQVLGWNPAAERIFGYTEAEALGRHATFIVPEAGHPVVEPVMRDLTAGSGGERVINENLRKDGGLILCEWYNTTLRDADGRVVGVTSLVDDVTERRRLEEERHRLQLQLHHAQKMESLGSLASGVAHDMNNVLGAILGMASVHHAQAEPGSPLQRGLETITKAAQRGGQLVKGLLNFARQSPSEERELDLNTILREEVQLLERTTLARVHVELELAPDLRPVRGDAGSLIHAFMNLCVNAVDAMEEGGHLFLRTRNLDDGGIEVQVEDTGSGMTAEVLEKAFDPFFTTKSQGKGTGLGLAIVYGTVKAHRGQIEVHSEPGRGTRVQVRFPGCPSVAPEPQPEPKPGQSHNTHLRVLLIDDDDLIRDSVTALLGALGHEAVVAESGEVALTLLEAGERPDLIILDLNMPGLGGARTLPRLRTLRPETPVLLATGRADQAAIDLAAAYPEVTLLAKPFSVDTLQLQIEQVGRV